MVATFKNSTGGQGQTSMTFFHRKASAGRKKNRVEKLARPDGSSCEDQADLGRMTTGFYKKKLYVFEGTISIEEVLSCAL